LSELTERPNGVRLETFGAARKGARSPFAGKTAQRARPLVSWAVVVQSSGMPDERRLVRHLAVLREEALREPVPTRKFFAIGNPSHIEGYGETLPLLSWVDDNLSRFVVSDTPSSSWGRTSPAPFVYALPNMPVKPKDGVFLVTGAGEDRSEPHPSGEGELKIVFMKQPANLWTGGVRQVHIYRLEAVQTKRIAG
jgi:hypothetical protein